MPGGRPTDYDPKFIKEVDKYLKERQDDIDEYHKTRGIRSDSYDRLVRVKLPTIEGFALRIGVNKTTLYEWEKREPEFSNALEKIRTEQLSRLVDGGLSGDYNPAIAKLILSSNHGMRERTDITTNDQSIIDDEAKEKGDSAVKAHLKSRSS